MMNYIVGCDECGTGSWCGPLVVCGVRAPEGWSLEGLNDSKKLTPSKRQAMSLQLEQLIISNQITWALAQRANTVIDQLGLAVALKDAYLEVFHQLYQDDSLIIIDGNLKFDGLGVDNYQKQSLVRADSQIPQVMAASILGKVYRDGLMHKFHNLYPVYGWDSNVGYIGKKHIGAVKQHGYTPLHRMSYKVKGMKDS
jgi:ribonuclease HII